MTPLDAAVAVRSFPRRYRALLVAPRSEDDGPDAVYRRRPHPSKWSALEHTAHVADRLDHLGPAILQVTRQNTPSIETFDNEKRAVAKGYNELDRTEALGWLGPGVRGAGAPWCSTMSGPTTGRGRRWWPASSARRLTLARATGVHEGAPHLRDAPVGAERRAGPAGGLMRTIRAAVSGLVFVTLVACGGGSGATRLGKAAWLEDHGPALDALDTELQGARKLSSLQRPNILGSCTALAYALGEVCCKGAYRYPIPNPTPP